MKNPTCSVVMSFAVAAALTLAPGCEQPQRAADAAQHALEDALICNDLVRPGDLADVERVLGHLTPEQIAIFALDPARAARVVALLGPEVEGTVVLAQNLRALLASDALADALTALGDAPSPNPCPTDEPGPELPFACTAGAATAVATCSANGSHLEIVLDGCVLQGHSFSGGLVVARDGAGGSQDLAATLLDLTVDEVTLVAGGLTLQNAPSGGLSFHVDREAPISVVRYAGIDGGLSCGSTVDFDALDVDVKPGDAVAIALASRALARADDHALEGVRTQTLDGPMVFPLDPAAPSCACPVAGSGLQLDVVEHGLPKRFAVRWTALEDASACPTATVDIKQFRAADDGAPSPLNDAAAAGDRLFADVVGAALSGLCALPAQ